MQHRLFYTSLVKKLLFFPPFVILFYTPVFMEMECTFYVSNRVTGLCDNYSTWVTGAIRVNIRFVHALIHVLNK